MLSVEAVGGFVLEFIERMTLEIGQRQIKDGGGVTFWHPKSSTFSPNRVF
jgi:hypothetical protein